MATVPTITRNVAATVASYRGAMRDFAKMTNLDLWYAHADLDQLKAQFDSQMKARQRNIATAPPVKTPPRARSRCGPC